MWGDVGRCGEIWGDVVRYGEVWGDMGRYGEIWGDMGSPTCRKSAPARISALVLRVDSARRATASAATCLGVG